MCIIAMLVVKALGGRKKRENIRSKRETLREKSFV
jgi:hypothetical protein